MNKVKKIVAVMMACTLCATMIGCGSKEPEEHLEMAPAVAPAEVQYNGTSNLPAGNSSKSDEPLDAAEDIATTNETDDFYTGSGRIPSDFTSEFPAEEPALDEVSGIIVLETDWRHETMNRNIYCLDPDTGTTTLLCTFPCDEMGTSAQGGYCFRINPELRRYVNFYDMFDTAYTKAILTKDLKNGNTHAGWIDRDGVFFDVTEELDEQPGDFEEPIEWRSVGFQGDTFIYAKATHDNMNPYEYYGVDINNLAPGTSWPIDLADKQILAKLPDNNSYGYNFYRPSSWIDDVWFYGEEVTLYGPYESVKFNSQTGESQQYIPGSSRYNWSAVGSPDGQRVAFLSTPKEGQSADIGLYVMPANGGDPQKVQTNIFYDYAGAGLSTVPQIICPLYVSYHLLEWK